MMRAADGHHASIPEIYAINAADHSYEISLALLDEIEQTVDSLTKVEHALEGIIQVAHAAERMWDDIQPPVEMPPRTDKVVETLEKTADGLKRSYDVYCENKQAVHDDRRLRGDNETLIVDSYQRVLDRFPGALEAVESLKWTLMDLQSLSSPVSKSYADVDELLADLKA